MFAEYFEQVEEKLKLEDQVEKIVLFRYKPPVIVLKNSEKTCKERRRFAIVPDAIHEREKPIYQPTLIGELPEELMMLLQMIADKQNAENLGLKIPNILLVGPPGVGKTYIAKYIAEMAKLPISVTSAASIHSSKFVGDNIKKIDEIFAKGKDGIIFIDELDAIGSRDTEQEYRVESITHLLSKLDGFNTKDAAMIIGATNNIDSIDEALLRQGRFDRLIELKPPTDKTICALLIFYSRTYRYDASINFESLAEIMSGCTHADVSSIPNAAGWNAFYLKQKFIKLENYIYAISKCKEKHANLQKNYLRKHQSK